MVEAGFIHALIFVLEDVFIWISGREGYSLVLTITLITLIAFYYRQIFNIIKLMLIKIGI